MVSAITLMIIMTQATKTDKFSGNIRRGWGVIFNPKVYVANFGPLYRLFRTFSAREIAYNFLKMRVGDQRTFEIFLKIHPFWYKYIQCHNVINVIIFISKHYQKQQYDPQYTQ